LAANFTNGGKIFLRAGLVAPVRLEFMPVGRELPIDCIKMQKLLQRF